MLNLQEQNLLIDQYMPLANRIAYDKSKIVPKFIDIEELKSAAYMGLVKAARNFEPEKTVFGFYAKLRISGEIQDYLRSLHWGGRKQKISVVESDVDFEDKSAIITTNETEELMEKLVFGMDDVAKDTMFLYYVKEQPLKSIAKKHGLSLGRVSQIMSKAKEIIQKRWDFEELLQEVA